MLNSSTNVFSTVGTSRPKLLASCMMGNALEWFDFALFGYFAKTIGRAIFPAGTDANILLKSYWVFFLGFIMRPLGAIVFGYIGDLYGRQKALMWAIYCMAIPTAMIGLLPPYQWVGSVSAYALILLRMLQGLSMGGEFTGSMIVVVEHAPEDRKGWWGSWTTASVAGGLLLGCGSSMVLHRLLSESAIELWGWRLPFVASLGGSWLGLILRKSMLTKDHGPDNTLHQSDGAESEPVSKPVSSVSMVTNLFRHHWRSVAHIFLVDIVVAIGFFLVTMYAGQFVSQYGGLTPEQSTTISTQCLLVFALSVLVSGRLSDRIGWQSMLQKGVVILMLVSVPCFYVLQSGWGVTYVTLAQGMLSLAMGMVFAPIPAYVVSRFPPQVRYSGVSIAHNLSMTIFGGSAMLVVTFFIKQCHHWMGNPWSIMVPGVYLMGACLVSYTVLRWNWPLDQKHH